MIILLLRFVGAGVVGLPWPAFTSPSLSESGKQRRPMSVQAISWVLDNSQSRLADRLVLISIANHCDKYGKDAWPMQETIAEEAHVSVREVVRSIQALAELGELSVEKGKGKIGRNLYSLPIMLNANLALRPPVLSDKSDIPQVTNPAILSDKYDIAIRKNRPEPSLEPTVQFSLTSPAASEGNEPTRFSQFKGTIFAFYRWKWKNDDGSPCDPMWNGAEAKQLSELLKANPKLEVRAFARWLKNYGESKDISPGERPARFLAKIDRYSQTTLNTYGRDENVEIQDPRGVTAHNRVASKAYLDGIARRASGAAGQKVDSGELRSVGKVPLAIADKRLATGFREMVAQRSILPNP